MREAQTLLLTNNKGADQPAHPHSLMGTFVICYLKSKVLKCLHCGGLQHDEDFGYTSVGTHAHGRQVTSLLC